MSEGVGKRCRSATESQKSRRALDRQQLWFVDPPWDCRLGVIRQVKRVKKGAKRSFKEEIDFCRMSLTKALLLEAIGTPGRT